MPEAQQVILASKSTARQAMLRAAGLVFRLETPDVDERALTLSPVRAAEMALKLAEAKAQAVSTMFADAIVIGGDQTLALGDCQIYKVDDAHAARQVLFDLRGKAHELHSAAAIAIHGEIRWSHASTARLFVRQFSDAWLDRYLSDAGDVLTQSVGAYAFEGRGIQLFDKVEGDYFTILGLPLLPLLAELRRLGVLTT